MYGKRNEMNGLKESYLSHANTLMGLPDYACAVQERRPYCLCPAGSLQGFLCGSPRSLWCSRCLSWTGDRRTCRKEDASALPRLTSAYHTGDTHGCALASTQRHTLQHTVRSKISVHCLICRNSCVVCVYCEFYTVTLLKFKQLLYKYNCFFQALPESPESSLINPATYAWRFFSHVILWLSSLGPRVFSAFCAGVMGFLYFTHWMHRKSRRIPLSEIWDLVLKAALVLSITCCQAPPAPILLCGQVYWQQNSFSDFLRHPIIQVL